MTMPPAPKREKYLPRLVLPGPVAAGGFLVFDAIRIRDTVVEGDASRVVDRPLTVKLNGRHLRFLKALASHWRPARDDDLDGGAPYLPVERIAGEFYGENELAAAPDAETLRAYAAQINRRIRQATPPGMPTPQLHESARLLGYRLVEKLEISTFK
jgi:hypothetical protein